MPDHLIMIRSGASDFDEQGRIRGTLALPLSAAGATEARRAATLLAASSADALYTSTDACAAETAHIVGAACGLRPKRIANLSNLDQGLWQGMLVDEIRERQPRLYRQWQDNPWAVAPPEGELLEEACLRVEAALEALVRRHPAGRVAVVVPQPLDHVVRWIVSGESMGDLWGGEPERPPVAEFPLAAQWRPTRRRRPTVRQR
ncbi:MAG: histidine phosphatase family protein [Planctomycetaceae bacterium]